MNGQTITRRELREAGHYIPPPMRAISHRLQFTHDWQTAAFVCVMDVDDEDRVVEVFADEAHNDEDLARQWLMACASAFDDGRTIKLHGFMATWEFDGNRFREVSP